MTSEATCEVMELGTEYSYRRAVNEVGSTEKMGEKVNHQIPLPFRDEWSEDIEPWRRDG